MLWLLMLSNKTKLILMVLILAPVFFGICLRILNPEAFVSLSIGLLWVGEVCTKMVIGWVNAMIQFISY